MPMILKKPFQKVRIFDSKDLEVWLDNVHLARVPDVFTILWVLIILF